MSANSSYWNGFKRSRTKYAARAATRPTADWHQTPQVKKKVSSKTQQMIDNYNEEA